MGQVHDLPEAEGKQNCLDLDMSGGVVDAAAAYMSYENASKAFIFSGWRRPPFHIADFLTIRPGRSRRSA